MSVPTNSEPTGRSSHRSDSSSEDMLERVEPSSKPTIPVASLSRTVSGPVYRIDAPHPHFAMSAFVPSSPPPYGSANPTGSSLAATAPFSTASPFNTTVPGPGPRPELSLLQQAGQLMEQLQTQYADLDQREQLLKSEWARFEWEQRQARLQWQQQQADLQDREARLRTVEDELQGHRRTLESHAVQQEIRRRELEAAANEVARQKESLRDSVQAELANDRAELEQLQAGLIAERDQLREIARLQTLHQEERLAQVEQQLKHSRDHLLKELAQEWESHRTEFEQQQAEFDAARLTWQETVGSQQVELQRERALLENRLRFQQEHLEKTRQDLETSQQLWRVSRQRELQQLQAGWDQHQRQHKQLQLQRTALEELSKSLERERELLLKSRTLNSTEVDADWGDFQAEKQQWEQERQQQIEELRRQQDLLAAHAENLEVRRSRLDQLRGELEETHRQTLEMRLAIEETWAELSMSAGDAQVRQRVEQARQEIIDHYSNLHDALDRDRRELFDVQSRFEHQRVEFQSERQTLIDWVTARDEQLRIQEAQVARLQGEWQQHESTWHTARDRWLQERMEAELVIRKLLQELTDHDTALPDDIFPTAA